VGTVPLPFNGTDAPAASGGVASDASSGSLGLGALELALSRTRVVVVIVAAPDPALRTVKLKPSVCPACTGFGLITRLPGTGIKSGTPPPT
jgi:hypothetical protein